MAPRPRWWKQLQEAKKEALLAIDLFNRVSDLRRLEAFIVHMQIAWLYLLQARFDRDDVDYWYRSPGGRRIRGEDGEFRAWSLRESLAQQFPDPSHPVRRNVEFFIGLRDRIEHRSTADIEPAVSGRCQALILNFERALTDLFGEPEGLADQLRFPIFLSTLTSDAIDALKEAYRRMPRGVASYIDEFDAATEEHTRSDQRYEFRVLLVPQTGPKSEADVAMEFVRADELSAEQRQGLEVMRTIVREKRVPVANLDKFSATRVCERVCAALDVRFSPYSEHLAAWRHYGVRPESGDSHPERTDERYCVYDPNHGDWVYTQAWIDKLIRELGDSEHFRAVTGHDPVRMPQPRPVE